MTLALALFSTTGNAAGAVGNSAGIDVVSVHAPHALNTDAIATGNTNHTRNFIRRIISDCLRPRYESLFRDDLRLKAAY